MVGDCRLQRDVKVDSTWLGSLTQSEQFKKAADSNEGSIPGECFGGGVITARSWLLSKHEQMTLCRWILEC